MACFDCPRECKSSSFCGKSQDKVRIAKVMRHFFEEPIICSSEKGCGAIFFSYCSLKCAYCQNYEITHEGKGIDYSPQKLTHIFEDVANSGVTSLDLVTPTHYTSYILTALENANINVPVVWNTSGYERCENIEKLSKYVDIFLFDFKYYDSSLAMKLSKAPNYFDVCMSALKKARELIPHDVVQNGIMKKGIIVRHLVLPGHTDDSIKIFEEIKNKVGTDVYVSLMSQFYPCYKACDVGLNRTLLPLEYKKVLASLKRLGFNKGFVQEMSSADKCYTPSFDLKKHYEL